jgi:L-fuconolactonase
VTDPIAPIVDSHHHLWDPRTRDYPWLRGNAVLEKPFGIADLRPELEANGIAATVLVQTVSDVEETREFLRLAADTPEIAGVVGWVDLTDPGITGVLHDLTAGPGGEYLVGIRHQIHDETDPDWALQESVQFGLEEIAEAGLVYDLLVRPLQLPAAITIARDFPHLRFVVDHIAKPDIASGAIDEWAALMHEFAPLENVACKLSGMLTEAGEGWTLDTLLPYIRTCVEIFGPDRLMYGSDWPVCLLASDYTTVYQTLRQALTTLELPPQPILGATAIRWYGLDLV